MMRLSLVAAGMLAVFILGTPSAVAQEGTHTPARTDLHVPRPVMPDRDMVWPTRDQWLRVLTLRDYNTRIILLGTVLLGSCAGVVGTFMLLRKRALVGDVVSHASLPGIAIAFLLMEAVRPGSGKSLPGLLTGALLAGLLGVSCVTLIRRATKIKDDAALAVVLSVFFGLGIALFTVVQKVPTGNSAGLKDFILGRTAAMIASDVWLIAWAALGVMLVCGLLFKEFSLLCFDQDYAATLGWPVVALDLALMALVVCVTVIGLQSVGLLLVVALLIVPAAAARFWTDRLLPMAMLAGALGGVSACLGVIISALLPRLAAGPVIVLVGAACFVFSMLAGTRRGVLRRTLAQRRSQRRVGRQDLLRAAYECLEPTFPGEARHAIPREMTAAVISFDQLLARRSWPAARLRQLLTAAVRESVFTPAAGGYRFTANGALQAFHAVRNHRLWETYLVTYADVAPSQVDRDADRIEHVLEPELIDELEDLLAESYPRLAMPPSPHPLPATTE
ncbi:MAG: iron chelate uptake ABC transporter family permease subunit [Pirellulales bacterium]